MVLIDYCSTRRRSTSILLLLFISLLFVYINDGFIQEYHVANSFNTYRLKSSFSQSPSSSSLHIVVISDIMENTKVILESSSMPTIPKETVITESIPVDVESVSKEKVIQSVAPIHRENPKSVSEESPLPTMVNNSEMVFSTSKYLMSHSFVDYSKAIPWDTMSEMYERMVAKRIKNPKPKRMAKNPVFLDIAHNWKYGESFIYSPKLHSINFLRNSSAVFEYKNGKSQ